MEAQTRPIRQCAGCRRRRAQAELQRFVRTGPKMWEADPVGKRRPGRGTYLCKTHDCASRVEKNKKFPGLAAAAAEYGF